MWDELWCCRSYYTQRSHVRDGSLPLGRHPHPPQRQISRKLPTLTRHTSALLSLHRKTPISPFLLFLLSHLISAPSHNPPNLRRALPICPVITTHPNITRSRDLPSPSPFHLHHAYIPELTPASLGASVPLDLASHDVGRVVRCRYGGGRGVRASAGI